jgi:hypothetical protein
VTINTTLVQDHRKRIIQSGKAAVPPQDAELQELLRVPREAPDVEIKDWLDLEDKEHRATLAKEIIALANHGGGFVVVGLTETKEGNFLPGKARPGSLVAWSQDHIQSAVVSKYIEPSFQCRVLHLAHPDTQELHPVIVVPGGQRVPIRARSGSPDNRKLMVGRTYIRRPGPTSEEPQTAAEWNDLLERCLRNRQAELIAGIRDLLAGAVPTVAGAVPKKDDLTEFIDAGRKRWQDLIDPLPNDAPARFNMGHYEAGMAIEGDFEELPPREFREVLARALRNHSGWPPFLFVDRPPHGPSLVHGAIESWLGVNEDGSYPPPSHADFWRVSPKGLFFTKRGFLEDDRRKSQEPGSLFNITTPIWRVGEIILQGVYVARALGVEAANLNADFMWTGLKGRKLVALDGPSLSLPRFSHQDTFQCRQTVSIAAVPSALPEVVFSILDPLYQLFDFFSLPRRLVETELQKLTAQTFAI